MGRLEGSVRSAGPRVIAGLAGRYRDLDIAEEAFAEACARAAEAWPRTGEPNDPAAWLYRTADRAALDMLRKRRVRQRLAPEPEETAEMEEPSLIPDDRLRLIFVCCHPAVAPDARAALTLRLVCGLTTAEVARAFLVPEPTLAQRLVRAKRKIAEAGVPFEVPGPAHWPERLDAVLLTLELAYAKAHEDAAGAGPYAGYGPEMLELTRLLTELLPDESEALALAALVRFAEARRPARVRPDGAMVPLSEQDPALWRRDLIADGMALLARARRLGAPRPRLHQAELHAVWCARRSLTEPPPWRVVLALYDAMLAVRDDAVVRLNRAVALAEVAGPGPALQELEAIGGERLDGFLPFQAVRAGLLRRAGRLQEAAEAYRAALALEPPAAERLWLERRLAELDG
jgi:RNA polymerase sigma-70 factor (ECF subfamily)